MSLCATIPTHIAVSLLLKAVLTALIVLIAFGFGNAGLFLIRAFVCTAVGMLICGAAILIHELTGSDMIFAANGYVYLNVSALILVISSAVIYGVLSLIRRILDAPVTDKPIRLTVTFGGSTAELSAIADSGNRLCDFLTGLPVIICKLRAVETVLPPNVKAYLDGNTDDITGIRIIPMNTASGSDIAAAFRPDVLTADCGGSQKRLDALIGVNEQALRDENIDAVIPAKLLR